MKNYKTIFFDLGILIMIVTVIGIVEHYNLKFSWRDIIFILYLWNNFINNKQYKYLGGEKNGR